MAKPRVCYANWGDNFYSSREKPFCLECFQLIYYDYFLKNLPPIGATTSIALQLATEENLVTFTY